MRTLWQDLHYGARMLLKKPGFTFVAVLTLALGIGANTAIFSVVNAVLLRPLGYKEPERLVTLSHSYPKLNLIAPVSVAGYFDYKSQSTVFEDVTAFYNSNFNLVDQGAPERIQGRLVTTSFFPLLGFDAAQGRTFLKEEDEPGRNRVVVISNGLWQRRFGSDPKLIGKTITLNNESHTVIGVMPASFQFSKDELWTPLAFTPEQLAPNQRGNEYLGMIGHLKPGVTLEQAQAEMNTIVKRVVANDPDSYPPDGTWWVPVKFLHEQMVGDIRPALLVLLGAVSFLLLIACSNVANLMLARATARCKEIAIRTALGASRLRLIRQLLTESVLLALLGGGVGLLLANWGVDLLMALNPDNIPRAREIGIDGRVLGFTLGVSLLTGIIFGLWPALQASKTDLTGTLKEGGRTSASGFRLRSARSLLVVSEVAIALVLLIGAGLLIKSFARLLDVNPGFETQNLLTMQISLPATKYREPPQVRTFYRQLVEQIKILPGVESVGAVSNLPLSGSVTSGSFQIEGRPVPPGTAAPHSDRRAATSDYLQTMKIPLLKGRHFTDRDNAEAPLVAIIDETMARLYWPNEDPVGKRLSFQNVNQWREIVGVVGPVKHKALDADLRGQLYYPHAQSAQGSMYLVVRTATNPMSLASAVQNAVRTIDKDQPVYNVRTMQEIFSNSVAQRRFSMLLLGIFAAVALVLAAVGLYGVMAYSVTQRTHEIGVRMALGAQPDDVLKMVLGQGAVLALVGVTIGLIAAFALTRVMLSLLFGVSATDTVTFVSISLLLTVVALLASYIPARRATKVDPMVALRYE